MVERDQQIDAEIERLLAEKKPLDLDIDFLTELLVARVNYDLESLIEILENSVLTINEILEISARNKAAQAE